MHGNSTVPVVVEPGGDQVVAHVGLHALGAFADRLGFGDALSARIPLTGERSPLHDRGKVLVQAMLMLAGGGEACTDIEHLRAQEPLFGAVPSDSTLYRTFRSLDAGTLAGLWEAMGEVRAEVWSRASATTGTDVVVLDIRMPRCTGLEAMELISLSHDLRKIPVVMFTTSRRDADMERGLSLGATRFEIKPSTYPALVAFAGELAIVARG